MKTASCNPTDALRLLIVEDSEDDTWLIVRQLQQAGLHPDFQRVETLGALREALDGGTWDLIICDFSLPQFGGPAALAIYRQHELDIPFIIVSGAIGEETAVEMMKAGAHDYVMKNNLARLGPVVHRELAAAKERCARKQVEAARAHLAAIVECCDEAIVGKTLDGTVVSWNAAAERLYGYTAAEILGRSVSILVPPYRPRDLIEVFEMAARGERVEAFETIRVRKDGTPIEVSLVVSPIKDASGRVVGASSVGRDISRRKEEERERLRLIEELTEALSHVKTLSGLLPICSSCKKIRNDQGAWQQFDVYVREHSQVEFSHGLCPECGVRLYPEYLHKSGAPRH
jgi:PAS domain S-box-containing protein